MIISDEFKKLGEGIISSYNLRIKAVGEIVSETHNMLTEFQKEQEILRKEHKTMADKLQKNLERVEKDRLQEFHRLMIKIKSEKKVLLDEVHTMADELKKSLKKGEIERLEEFNKMMADILSIQAARNKYVAELLQKFADEQKIIADEHNAMAETWKVFNKNVPNLKSGQPTLEKKVKVRSVKKAVEKEKPRKTKSKPEVKEQPWKKDIPVEDKVLAFINAHPKGVKVSDMEEPVGVVRMRLGVLAKSLLEAGKVRKVDNVYFPIVP